MGLSFFTVLVFAICVFPAYGTPSISGVSGVILDGRSVIISGSGFGVKNPAAPLKWDKFNAGAPGQQLVAYDPYWVQGNNAPMTISSENARSGNNIRSVLKASDPGDQSSMVWHDDVGFANTGKIYLNYWVRLDFGTALSPGYFQVKNIEIAVSTDGGNGGVTTPMVALNHFAYENSYTQCLFGNYRSNFNIKGDLAAGSALVSNVDYRGRSVVNGMKVSGTGVPSNASVVSFTPTTLTMSAPANASASQATLTISTTADPTIYFPNDTFPRYSVAWRNVSMQVDMGDIGVSNASKWAWASAVDFAGPYVKTGANNRNVLDAAASGKLDMIKIGWYRSGYVAGAIAAGTSVVQYDDLYMDNSWAHVEIGDQPTYDSCTHREMQPPSAWADSSVTIVLNRGTFSQGSTVYVYVIDENGVVNASGYPIVLATGTGPAPPRGLNLR